MVMSRVAHAPDKNVSPEEEQRRLDEYRQQGFGYRTMPHIIYHGAQQLCPWPGCGFRIAGIDFQLEKMADPKRYAELLAAWWQGPGLAGRCPSCGHYVLFALSGKQQVADPESSGYALLPDDWFQKAYIL
jgi:hypothetical protein